MLDFKFSWAVSHNHENESKNPLNISLCMQWISNTCKFMKKRTLSRHSVFFRCTTAYPNWGPQRYTICERGGSHINILCGKNLPTEEEDDWGGIEVQESEDAEVWNWWESMVGDSQTLATTVIYSCSFVGSDFQHRNLIFPNKLKVSAFCRLFLLFCWMYGSCFGNL